jgi:hypothetical protein
VEADIGVELGFWEVVRRAEVGGRERTGREFLAASDEMLIDVRQQRPITLEEVTCLGEGTTVVKEEEQLRLELEGGIVVVEEAHELRVQGREFLSEVIFLSIFVWHVKPSCSNAEALDLLEAKSVNELVRDVMVVEPSNDAASSRLLVAGVACDLERSPFRLSLSAVRYEGRMNRMDGPS